LGEGPFLAAALRLGVRSRRGPARGMRTFWLVVKIVVGMDLLGVVSCPEEMEQVLPDRVRGQDVV
jgi:hypothetical protein